MAEKQLTLTVLLPEDLADAVKGLGTLKSRLLDQLASALESGDIDPSKLPEDPLRCKKGVKVKRVTLKASRESYGILKSYAERLGVSTSELMRRLVAWFIGYECQG